VDNRKCRTSKVVALGSASAIIAAFVGKNFVDASANATIAEQKTGGKVLIAFAIMHVAFYSMFWGPTPWVLLGETFPLRVRPKCIALGSAANWLWNFLLSYFSPFIVDDHGS
jgi:SP family sugar:H+ symporter-like MFS transporter